MVVIFPLDTTCEPFYAKSLLVAFHSFYASKFANTGHWVAFIGIPSIMYLWNFEKLLQGFFFNHYIKQKCFKKYF